MDGRSPESLWAPHEEQEHLRFALQAATVGHWYLDLASGTLQASEQCKANLGVPAGEDLSSYARFLERILPEDRARVRAAVEEAVACNRDYFCEYRVVGAKGEVRHVSARGRPVAGAGGAIVGMAGVTIDMTEQRRAEAKRVEAIERERNARAEALSEQLRERDEQLRAVAENIPELAWSAQPDGHIDYYNRRWYEYTGTTFESMQGWGWQSVHDPEMLPKVVERWRRSLATGEPFEMEFPLRGADGVFRWFLTRVSALRNARGEIVRWFGTNTNIDEERRTRTQLREAVDARDVFLSVASHELKTPLTALSLSLQMLERKADSPTQIEMMSRQVRRLSDLVNQLLDVARLTSGKITLHPEDVDLGALVREVVSRFSWEAERAGCKIEVRVEGKVAGRWDSLRLEQVLSNLLSNALKYAAGKPIEVRVSAAAGAGRIEVRDQGIGIAAQDLERIFRRFERAVSDRSYGGLGLGLYVTRQLVEAMGGTVKVESTPGEGALFVVELSLEAPLA